MTAPDDPIERAQRALLSAFESRGELEEMCRAELGVTLAHHAGGGALSGVIYELLTWAEAEGRVAELVSAASRARPRNQPLRELAGDMGLPLPAQGSASRQRLYSDVFDSVNQRRVHDVPTLEGSSLKALYLGRLRLELLLRDEVVITDTQLLDGEFFLSLGRELLRERKHEQGLILRKVVVRARAGDLPKARLGFIKDKRGFAKSFSFSSIRDTAARERVATRLKELRAEQEAQKKAGRRVRKAPWRNVWRALLDLEVPPEEVDRLKDAWDCWDRLQKKHGLRVQVWDKETDFESIWKDASTIRERLRIPAGRGLMDKVRALSPDRSAIEALLLPYRRELHDALLKLDAVDIWEWFQRRYNHAIARSHDADVIESVYAGTYSLGLDGSHQPHMIATRALESLAAQSVAEHEVLDARLAPWRHSRRLADLAPWLDVVRADRASRRDPDPDTLEKEVAVIFGALGHWDSVFTFQEDSKTNAVAASTLEFALRRDRLWSVTEYGPPADATLTRSSVAGATSKA